MSSLYELLRRSRRTVFFGGAGVSTESGIPDFRSARGIFQSDTEIPAETMLSHTYFEQHTAEFFDFYRTHLVFPKARPNRAHRALALLEEKEKLLSVVTQNVDGLHQAAGSRTVRELHGSVHRNFCMDCRHSVPLEDILGTAGIPKCPHCGGIVKPDVVLYEEPLDGACIEAAIQDIARADMLIIGGTSLAVYPAAGLIRYFRGRELVIINKSPTPQDSAATLLLQDSIGECLAGAAEELYGTEIR